ncbi:hypothetical protein [Metabacillus idriensis]|uniref:DUF7167 family protein n=1 Tax=Metabacillus idriensis TaxID=324768 RepID=UPI001CD4DD0A|nr:hypothetical protein [Metabacillus idriensis]
MYPPSTHLNKGVALAALFLMELKGQVCLIRRITVSYLLKANKCRYGDKKLGKTVTFSVGTKYEDSKQTETFTFEKLGIDEDMDETKLKKVIDDIFQAWVWDKLNISYSIVIYGEDALGIGDF